MFARCVDEGVAVISLAEDGKMGSAPLSAAVFLGISCYNLYELKACPSLVLIPALSFSSSP